MSFKSKFFFVIKKKDMRIVACIKVLPKYNSNNAISSKINFINESWMEKKAIPVIIKKIPLVLLFVCISHLYQKNFNLHN